MEGKLSLKRCLGHCCPELNQLHVPLNTRVVRNAVCSHFERFTCHSEDEIVSRTQCSMDDEDSVPVLTCQFSRDGLGGHLLATGDEQGQVLLMDTRKRAQQSVIEEFMAHRNAIHEVCWNRNGSELVTASADNTIKLWDINCSCKELSTLRGHQGTVKSVDVHREEPTIIVSGGRDGVVAVWDTRYNNRGTHHSPLRISQCQYPQAVMRMRFRAFVQKESTARHSVSAVRFLGDHGILTSGIDGVIKFWDKRLLSEVCHTFEAPVKLGITAIALDTSHTQIFASCKDSKIYAFDCMKSQKTPVAQYSGHTVSSYYVKLALSPDDRYLLSGSANVGVPYSNGGHIWEVNNKEGADYDMSPLVMLPGQGGEVTGVAWCPSQLSKIVTCSDNHDTWIWRTSNDSSDKIIAHCQQHGVRGYLRVRPPKTPTPMPSPSNCSQQTVDVDEDKAVMKNKDQINNWSSEVTTPVTSPPIKCINSGYTNGGSGNESRERGIPLDCITNNNTLSLSLTPKRKATVNHTKQVTLKLLLQKPTPSPSNCSQQPDDEDKVVMKNKDQTNNWSSEVTTPVTSPPIKCINSGGSGSESRKRGIPLDCITNNNTSSLSLTPKRKATVKCTKQVTLEILLEKPTPSPSNCSQQTVEVVVMKNKDQTNNWSSEITTPVTSPPIKCINSDCTNGGSGSESRKRGIPLDCITNNNTSSLSLTPTTVNRTKQVTLEILLQKPTPSPSNCSQQPDDEDKVVMKNKDQTDNWSSEVTTPVTSPPIKCINSGGSGSESRKRGIPLDCITNNNTSSLSLTPKRKATVKHTKQVTLEILLQRE